MNLPLIGKLVKEDFAQQFQDMVGKIGFIVNPAFQNIQSLLNNGLTFENNINCIVKSVTLSVGTNGNPTSSISFPTGLSSKVAHLIVTNCINQTNSSTYPSGAPFISYTDTGGVLTVNNITGLQPNNTWVLTLVGLV